MPQNQGKAEGPAACTSQTPSPFGSLNKFTLDYCLTFWGHFTQRGCWLEYPLSCDRPNIQSQRPSFIRKKVLTMYEEWSNNARRGYVIKAMENCGFKSKDIRQMLTELYEVFDFCAVEEAVHYYENWQS